MEATSTESPATTGRQPLPTLTPETTPFFTAGLDGLLVITRCGDCGYLSHPPLPACARCWSRNVSARPVSGRGSVEAFSVDLYPWHPAFPPPYVVAIVSLEEQSDVHLTTNIVDCNPDEVHIGMAVQVTFRVCEDADGSRIALPVFAPAPTDGDAHV